MISKEQFAKIYGEHREFDWDYWFDVKIYQKFQSLYMHSIGVGLHDYFLESLPTYRIILEMANEQNAMNGTEYLMYQVIDYFCSLADNKRITEKNELAKKLVPKYKLVKYSFMNMKEIADKLTEKLDSLCLNRVSLSGIDAKFGNENLFIPKYRFGVKI